MNLLKKKLFQLKTFVNTEKVLPMKYPVVSSYPYHSDILAVISNDDEYLPWLFNNYIQINYPKAYFKDGARLDFFSSCLWETCPYISYQLVCKDFISNKWSSLKDFLVYSINSGFYARLIVDKYNISCYWTGRKQHSPHDIFVFGYDTKRQIFNVADNFKDGKYSFETTSFKELEDAYINVEKRGLYDFLNGIELIRPKKNNSSYGFDYNYKLDVDLISDGIRDYLSSNIEKIKWPYIPSMQWKYDKDYYGLQVYTILLEYLANFENTIGIDLRPFFVLWEHKRIMLLRIKYMGDNNFLDDSGSLYSEYSKIERKAFTLNNIWMKYSVSKDKKAIDKIVNVINELYKEEPIILEKMLKNIRKVKISD